MLNKKIILNNLSYIVIKHHPQIEKEKKYLDEQIKQFMDIINKDETSNKLRDVNMVFFPIIAHGHYYVIVFDLEKDHAIIRDNSISDGDYDGKYKAIFVFVVSYVWTDL
jgi:hypothetical protein